MEVGEEDARAGGVLEIAGWNASQPEGALVPSELYINYAVGVALPERSLVSAERGATCGAILYRGGLAWPLDLVGDLFYPVKVLLVLYPLGLVVFMIGVALISRGYQYVQRSGG